MLIDLKIKKKKKAPMSPCGCNCPTWPRWSHARARPAVTRDSFEAPQHFHTPQLRHPTVNWVGNTNRMISVGSHLWKRASRPFLGSCYQRPVGAGGVLAQSPTIKVIRSHLITALLSTTPSTGLAAAHRWENHHRCTKETGKLLPFLK